MIAIIKSLFGGKKSNNNQPAPQKVSQEKTQAYFLDNDSAKSLGNIDYMRTPKSVKKSYPKGAGAINVISGSVEESISAMEKTAGGIASTTSTAASTSSSSSSVTPSPSFESNSTTRRRASSDIDSFRDMARSMKKK